MKSCKDAQKCTKVFSILVSLLLVFVLLFGLLVLGKRLVDRINLESEMHEINNILCSEAGDQDVLPREPNTDYFNFLKMSFDSIDIAKLKRINGDTVGFLSISGMNVNYPVVQSTDNAFYLNHSFKKADNGLGWVFMDYRNNSESFSRNTVIYGHSNLDKTMFGSLSNVMSEEWRRNPENGKIKFINLSGVTNWKIISVYTIPAESYYIKTDFRSNESFGKWLSEISGRSLYNFGYEVSADDKIMTFSTCYKNEGNIRLVIHAKKV